MTNPFSKDYVPKVKIDHRDRKYKRPVLNQPPVNARVNLNGNVPKVPLSDAYRRISKTQI